MLRWAKGAGVDNAGLAELRRRLDDEAACCGIDRLRIAAARPDAVARERLAAAFERGDLATWHFDGERARMAADPEAVLPGARAVVCVAVGYDTEPPAARSPLTGRISRYAWSEDYHRTLRRALERLEALLRPFGRARAVCDTVPFAERAFAERSGLGWVGRHTGVIVPGLGALAFLGEIVTDIPLPPDEPIRKSCGSCRRCVDVCPTGALRGDFTIDATRCIGDLNQRLDAIPRAMRPLMGDWVWGCDLCTVACPPSHVAPKIGRPAFSPAPGISPYPALAAILRLRSGEFKRTYRASAMGWRGGAILRRNAAVCLGNTLDRSVVPDLEGAFAEDPHALVRGHAAWALGRIGSPRALRALAARLPLERDAGVRDEIDAALAGNHLRS
ncbi:tRNA epoxyqueuosine(34) reductase QueG [bacterium]|nr:MAG: tRNA epoxyqueuosine(34) reductase QueG [bacterium]